MPANIIGNVYEYHNSKHKSSRFVIVICKNEKCIFTANIFKHSVDEKWNMNERTINLHKHQKDDFMKRIVEGELVWCDKLNLNVLC